MSQNYFNPYQQGQCVYPAQGPNAVSINIYSPQAYGNTSGATCPVGQMPCALYGANNQGMPLYPANYNNLTPLNQSANSQLNKMNMSNTTNLAQKTDVPVEENSTKETQKENNTKKVTPLTDDYIKSLENYMNDANPKVRLIGAKELLERFKEDENRKDNPSLMPLLNKALRDPSPSVRFLGLTMLQLGYALGNDETVAILKEIQTQNKDKIGEDSLLASEILLLMAGGEKVDAPMTQNEIEKAQAKADVKEGK